MTDKLKLDRIDSVDIQAARMYASIALAELDQIRPREADATVIVESGDELSAVQSDLMYFVQYTSDHGYPIDHRIYQEEMVTSDVRDHLYRSLTAAANALRAAKGTTGGEAADVSIADVPHKLRDLINEIEGDEDQGVDDI